MGWGRDGLGKGWMLSEMSECGGSFFPEERSASMRACRARNYIVRRKMMRLVKASSSRSIDRLTDMRKQNWIIQYKISSERLEYLYIYLQLSMLDEADSIIVLYFCFELESIFARHQFKRNLPRSIV